MRWNHVLKNSLCLYSTWEHLNSILGVLWLLYNICLKWAFWGPPRTLFWNTWLKLYNIARWVNLHGNVEILHLHICTCTFVCHTIKRFVCALWFCQNDTPAWNNVCTSVLHTYEIDSNILLHPLQLSTELSRTNPHFQHNKFNYVEISNQLVD